MNSEHQNRLGARPKPKLKTIRLTLDLEEDFYEEVALAALKLRIPKSKLIRKAIVLFLEQEKLVK